MLDLGAEEVSGSEVEVAFYVYDGDGGVGAGLFGVEFAEVSFVIDFVFDEVWA